jgi:hypothetical protein
MSVKLETSHERPTSMDDNNALDLSRYIVLQMISRNCLFKDEVNRLSIPTSMDDNNALDLSRYIVLQTQRTTKTKRHAYDRVKDSLVLNQGTTAKGGTSELLFECPTGKFLSMAVWDSSRKDVVSCKLDDDG